ncbi:MAG TPA: site-specific DNA-methyltransferase [Candidatus Sulfotelmatobacter sp.]|nr:site-specific DNA-methyltransferase [Candidatus Sulfotelmatobacter sp.]
MPIKKTPRQKEKSFYRSKPPRSAAPKPSEGGPDLPHAKTLEPRHFELREDWTVAANAECGVRNAESIERSPNLVYSHESPFIRLYHGDCFQLLDAIAARYPHGRFDAIFADPPYFLSNGGITCHAGKMVKVDKGDWDKSRGPELNHEFNREWLARCRRVLKPNGTIWVSGTLHVIFSIGYAMQQLGFKILNDIAWEKPNPPPNLSCRYFTHSTETILWAARDEKSKHTFNYDAMRAVTGKQMKTVWRNLSESREGREGNEEDELPSRSSRSSRDPSSIWTLSAPGSDEKIHGKHPTQKPVGLIERCLLASTNPGDLVLDPFLGGGTTAIAALKLKRGCVGIELDEAHAKLAKKRIERETHNSEDLWNVNKRTSA